MIISIVNRSNSIPDEELQQVIRAINRQIAEDFEPYWSFGARLRLEGKVGTKPDKESLADLRGDAVIYLWDQTDMEDALGYHDSNSYGIPYGFVFTELAKKLDENWTVTLSHEALELLGDSQGTLLVQGPHPGKPNMEVFHWFEMCDAVQAQTYKVDGIEVANFVLPLYFTKEEQEGGRNDFLGRVINGKGLDSFGVSAGGYIGFFNPKQRQHETWSPPADAEADKRLKIKRQAAFGRGYRRSHPDAFSRPDKPSNPPVQLPVAYPQLLKLATLTSLKSSSPSTATAVVTTIAVQDPIKHVVVLMMENRSFDHMLGGMRVVDPNVEGIDPDKPFFNTKTDGTKFEQQPIAKWVMSRDLDHEHEGAMAELGTKADPMSGFVSSHLKRYPDAPDDELKQVMAYFPFGKTPKGDALPVLHSLAREFGVCDHWFSSMPGPTWQNRFFTHSGTSLGHTKMPSMSDPSAMGLYYQETIFDRLTESGISWKIFHDGIPQSIVLTRLLTRYLTFRGYAGMGDFYKLAKGDPVDFPKYTFIEPCYFGKNENDQHPPADVRLGEQLISDVYNAIRSNPKLWESTLLVLTSDEHGGFYDHVAPPASVAPDDHVAEWSFDRLGVRVPTILVSPWIEKGVIKTVFDHTSLLRYLCEKWNLDPLGARMQAEAGDKRANSFADELTKRATPRTDTPDRVEPTKIKLARGVTAAVEPPIVGSREALLMFIDQLPDRAAAPLKKGDGKQVLRSRAMKSTKPVPQMSPADSVAAAEKKLESLRIKRSINLEKI